MLWLLEDPESVQFEALLPVLPGITPSRRERALSMRLESPRVQTILAELLLRHALLEEYGLTELPRVETGEKGKPFFPERPQLHFNLSHCNAALACALDSTPVGVDVESYGHLLPSARRSSAKGTADRRDGTLPSANGTAHRRDGTLPSANGTAHRRDGTLPSANGTADRRDGTLPSAKGAADCRDGTLPSANGTAHRRDGTLPSASSDPALFRVLSDPERQWVLAGESPQEQDRRFTSLWTCKEAYGKARGLGILYELSATEFAPALPQWSQYGHCFQQGREAAWAWTLCAQAPLTVKRVSLQDIL